MHEETLRQSVVHSQAGRVRASQSRTASWPSPTRARGAGHRRRRVARGRTPEPKSEPPVAGARRLDGAHRAGRTAADHAPAARRAGVRGAARPNARHGQRTGARAARARSRPNAPRRFARARDRSPMSSRIRSRRSASPSSGCAATRRPSSPRRSRSWRSSRSVSRRWRAASRSSGGFPKARGPRWTWASSRDTRRAPRSRRSVDVKRRHRRRRTDDSWASRRAGARAVQRDAERGRRVPRRWTRRTVNVRVRRTEANGRDSVEIAVSRHRVRHSARPSGAHLGSVRHVQAGRNGTRTGHRATDRARARRRVWPRTARSDAGTEIRFVLPVDGSRNGVGANRWRFNVR